MIATFNIDATVAKADFLNSGLRQHLIRIRYLADRHDAFAEKSRGMMRRVPGIVPNILKRHILLT